MQTRTLEGIEDLPEAGLKDHPKWWNPKGRCLQAYTFGHDRQGLILSAANGNVRLIVERDSYENDMSDKKWRIDWQIRQIGGGGGINSGSMAVGTKTLKSMFGIL